MGCDTVMFEGSLWGFVNFVCKAVFGELDSFAELLMNSFRLIDVDGIPPPNH